MNSMGSVRPSDRNDRIPPQPLLKRERKKREEDARACPVRRREAAGSGPPVVLCTLGSAKPVVQNAPRFHAPRYRIKAASVSPVF